MEIGVGQAAESLRVSQRRLRQLITDGVIPARREGGRWLIDESALNHAPLISRPMSIRVAWSLLDSLDGADPSQLRSDERQRLARKVDQLRSHDHALDLFRSWLASRAQRKAYSISPADAPDLLRDPRLVASGISDPRSGLSSAGEAEAYVHRGDLDGVIADYLLAERGSPNVWLHVSDHDISRPAPIGLVIADLADVNRPRERHIAQELLDGALK